MSCRERQATLQDYASGELPPDARRGLEAHLAQCHSCRQDLRAYRGLMKALPDLPVPLPPLDLSEHIMMAVRARHVAHRPEREAVSAKVLRRTLLVLSAAAFGVTLGAALWGWAARIIGFAGRSMSSDFLAFWEAAQDLWSLLQLLGGVASTLFPTARDLWSMVAQVGEPLAPYGPLIAIAYAGVLFVGAFLCWRALVPRGGRRLSHAS